MRKTVQLLKADSASGAGDRREGKIMVRGEGGGGTGAGEGQGPAHQSGAACVLHTLLSGGRRGAALASHCVGGGGLSLTTSQCQVEPAHSDGQ